MSSIKWRREKRGSRYLRYALYNAARYVCHWDPAFAAYLAKKHAEDRHYNVALSHAAKKLVRLVFAAEAFGGKWNSPSVPLELEGEFSVYWSMPQAAACSIRRRSWVTAS